MPALETNTVILAAVLPSGNKAVYEIEEHKLRRPMYAGQSQNNLVIGLGRLLATKKGNDWYNQRPGRASWSERIVDPKTIRLLESWPLAED